MYLSTIPKQNVLLSIAAQIGGVLGREIEHDLLGPLRRKRRVVLLLCGLARGLGRPFREGHCRRRVAWGRPRGLGEAWP